MFHFFNSLDVNAAGGRIIWLIQFSLSASHRNSFTSSVRHLSSCCLLLIRLNGIFLILSIYSCKYVPIFPMLSWLMWSPLKGNGLSHMNLPILNQAEISLRNTWSSLIVPTMRKSPTVLTRMRHVFWFAFHRASIYGMDEIGSQPFYFIHFSTHGCQRRLESART